MTVGERIKSTRESKSISQIELANACNISKQSLYKYENNIITNIPSDKIELIAKSLEVTPSYLMGWDKPKIILLKDDYKKEDDSEMNNNEIAVFKHFQKADIDTKMQVLADLEIGILGSPVGEYRYKKLTKLQRQIAESIDEQQIELIQNYIKLSTEGKKKLLDYSNDLVLLERYRANKDKNDT